MRAPLPRPTPLLDGMLDRFFPPTCPCDAAAKAWLEERLAWLTEQFDDHIFNGRPLVLPTTQCFPDAFDGSPQAVRAMLGRVCGYMDVDPESIELEFTSDAGKLWFVNEAGQLLPQAAGTYQDDGDRSLIRIETSELANPFGLAATLAHELSHVRLLGEGRLGGDEYDNELLTDLTALFFGFGIFLANDSRVWDSSYSIWPGTTLKKPEYMTRPMAGYALAHRAWFEGNRWPAWANHLHSNARPDFKQAVRYLFETRDSAFRPPGQGRRD